jgi:hypothetical protein
VHSAAIRPHGGGAVSPQPAMTSPVDNPEVAVDLVRGSLAETGS